MGVLRCWVAQAEVILFLRREGPLVPRPEKAGVWPCAVRPLPVTEIIPSVPRLANPAEAIGASVCKWGREHFPWLPSEC